VYGQPPTPNDRGPGINFKDCQVRFKLAWARIRPTLTEEAIANAAKHAEVQRQQSGGEGQPTFPETLQVLENKRAAPRQRVLMAPSNSTAVQLIASSGTYRRRAAALEVASPIGIPNEFNLLISGD
jgi:hypothetical protein